MARRRRGRNAVTFDNANFEQELLRPVELPSDPLSNLDMFMGPELPHDRRLFHFGEPEQYTLGNTETVRTMTAQSGRLPAVHREPSFTDPNTVAICLRRKVRKEVMIARGGRGSKRPKRKWYSNIRC